MMGSREHGKRWKAFVLTPKKYLKDKGLKCLVIMDNTPGHPPVLAESLKTYVVWEEWGAGIYWETPACQSCGK